jgi:hypothetical protein
MLIAVRCGRPAFPYGRMKSDLELVLLSAADLGVESESSLADVYKRARQVGLELCPAEVGPQLRLDYRNQPRGEVLHIAMQPVATYGGDPTILALAKPRGGALASRSSLTQQKSRDHFHDAPARPKVT